MHIFIAIFMGCALSLVIFAAANIICLLAWDIFLTPTIYAHIVIRYYRLFPHKLEPSLIEKTDNTLLADALFDMMPLEGFVKSKYFKKCCWHREKDSVGLLYVIQYNWRSERVHIVKVKNSTPEPDGTYKDYYIRVPKDCWSAKAGIAWTFGLPPSRYEPEIET